MRFPFAGRLCERFTLSLRNICQVLPISGAPAIVPALHNWRPHALNAVVHWNAIYMQKAIGHIRSDGMDVSNDNIAHLSPLIWRHLNFP